MSDFFDVAVVGAGMFGSAAGKYLSREGARVALLGPAEPENHKEASSQQTFGAYYDQARITRRLGWDEVWAGTDSRSLNRFRAIEADSGISFFHEKGSLVLMAKSIARRTESMLKQCQEAGIPVDRLSHDAIEHAWPYLRVPHMEGGVEGLYEKEMAGYLNPRRLVEAQLTLFKRNGGTLIRGSVTQVQKDASSNLWKLSCLQGGVFTEISAKSVLIAAGAFVNHNGILPNGYQLALHAYTEPNLLFEMNQEQVSHLQKMPTMITVDPEDTGNSNKSIYLLPPIQYPDGKWYTRIGPGMQPIVESLDTHESMRAWYIQQQITEQQREFLMRMQTLLLPDLQPQSVREACCIVEKTPSHHPYIGQVNEDCSLNVVVGGNGHGARGSDEIGRLAAGVVLKRAWDFPIPQSRFTPVLVTTDQAKKKKLQCKPPFGLC